MRRSSDTGDSQLLNAQRRQSEEVWRGLHSVPGHALLVAEGNSQRLSEKKKSHHAESNTTYVQDNQ